MTTLYEQGQALPAALRARPQWILWKYEPDKDGKPTKVPKQASGWNASSTKPSTWTTFENAYAAYLSGEFDGLGYVFSADDPFIAIDIDKCYDPEASEFNEIALETLSLIDTYAEFSPSRTGVHLIGEGTTLDEYQNKHGGLEVYDRGRFFTMTGHLVPNKPLDVRPVEEAVHEWIRENLPLRAKPSQEARPANVIPLVLADSDEARLHAAETAKNGPDFIALFYNRDMSRYGDDASRADLGLCNKLAFYWAKDPVAIDRMFRQSSLMRGKWERADYRAWTINKAIDATTEVYTPAQPHDRPIITIGGKKMLIEEFGAEAPMPFPVEALPPTFRALCEEGALSSGAPVDFYAVPLLAAAGAAIGPSYEFEIKYMWNARTALWAATIGVPGSGKSPGQRIAVSVLQNEQMRRKKVYDHAAQEYEEAMRVYETAPRNQKPERPVAPVLRSVIATDSTLEALIESLSERNGQLLQFDELSGFIGSMNQYKSGNKGNDREQMLSAWSGGAIFKRRTGNKFYAIASPHLSIVGGIQPKRLHVLETDGDDGLLARFLWSFPEAPVLDWEEAQISGAAYTAVQDVLLRLIEGSEAVPMVVKFGQGAKNLWVPWFNDKAAEQRTSALPDQLKGVWSKLNDQASRIALILHAVDDGGDRMSADTMERALVITDYFAAHARRVHSALAFRSQPLILKILKAIQDAGGKITKSALIRDALNRNVRASLVEEALVTLQTYEIIVIEKETVSVGRPAEIVRLA